MSGFGANYTVARVCIRQRIQLGLPDHFSLWEVGVWGWVYSCNNKFSL